MTYEVRGKTKDGCEISAVHTDSMARARTFSTTMHDNGHYADVFVVIGNIRLTHSEFLSRFGANNDNSQDLYRQ